LHKKRALRASGELSFDEEYPKKKNPWYLLDQEIWTLLRATRRGSYAHFSGQ